jgi:phosphoglucomutase
MDTLSKDYIENNLYNHVSFGTGGIRAKMGVDSNLLNINTITRITKRKAGYLKTQKIQSSKR